MASSYSKNNSIEIEEKKNLYEDIKNTIDQAYKKLTKTNLAIYEKGQILKFKDEILKNIEKLFSKEKNKDNNKKERIINQNIQNKNKKTNESKNEPKKINEKDKNKNTIQHIQDFKIDQSNKMDVNNIKKANENIIDENCNNNENKIDIKETFPKQKEESYNFSNINEKKDVFTPKEIEINYRKVTNEFEEYGCNYYNDNDKIDNQTIGEFLFKVANISRISFNDSNKFLKSIYEEYEKETKDKNKDIIISSIYEFKEEFSYWVKNNNQIIEKKLEEFDFIEEQKDKIKIEQLYKLYKDLLIIYFQCELSLPSIEIDFNFKINEDFNNETMIDCSKNKGKKKVNFVFFPSLKSNGNYLQNGKQWVFTYNENKTFFLKNIKELKPLIDKNNRFYIPMLKDKLKLNIKKQLIPNLNYKIDERVKIEYIFYLKNKKNKNNLNNLKLIKSDSSIIIEENEELFECQLRLMNEDILSFYNVDTN